MLQFGHWVTKLSVMLNPTAAGRQKRGDSLTQQIAKAALSAVPATAGYGALMLEWQQTPGLVANAADAHPAVQGGGRVELEVGGVGGAHFLGLLGENA